MHIKSTTPCAFSRAWLFVSFESNNSTKNHIQWGHRNLDKKSKQASKLANWVKLKKNKSGVLIIHEPTQTYKPINRCQSIQKRSKLLNWRLKVLSYLLRPSITLLTHLIIIKKHYTKTKEKLQFLFYKPCITQKMTKSKKKHACRHNLCISFLQNRALP